MVEVYVNADGKQAMQLTDDGVRLAQQMAMSDDPDAVLEARWGRSQRRKERPVPRGAGLSCSVERALVLVLDACARRARLDEGPGHTRFLEVERDVLTE